jgi:hypothetical protein
MTAPPNIESELAELPIAYSPGAAAVAAGRSRSRIFKAIKDRELTARKDGKATIIEASELRRWIRTFPTIGREATCIPELRDDGRGCARQPRKEFRRRAQCDQ